MSLDRQSALDVVAIYLQTGGIMHPKLHDQLREIIGETTEEEEAVWRAARRAGEAATAESERQVGSLAAK